MRGVLKLLLEFHALIEFCTSVDGDATSNAWLVKGA
jgi:hypothetical protein